MSSNLRVGLLCSRMRVEEKLLRDALEHRGLEVEVVDDRELTLTLDRPNRRWDVVLERSLSQTRGLALLRVLESWGVPTVNHHAVAAVCASKLDTSALLDAAGIPTPATAIAFSPDAARRAAEDLGYPVVLKPVTGSWGRLLARINDRDAAEALFEHKAVLGGPEHSIFYLQRHVDKPGRDIRAFVVGDDVICAIYRESGHWVTNTARGASARNCTVDGALRDLCLRAASAVGGGVLAIDLLEDGARLLVSEVNATMEFRNSIDVTGVDIPGRVAGHVRDVARGAFAGVGA
ncbi:MAG: lysine biosynthesis protein LysX [Candidatus Dormiibacterota bacterium]